MRSAQAKVPLVSGCGAGEATQGETPRSLTEHFKQFDKGAAAPASFNIHQPATATGNFSIYQSVNRKT